MAAKNGSRATAAAPVAEPEEREDEETPLITAVLDDITPESREAMRSQLSGVAKPIGPNVACNGFFKKSPGAQLVGRVVSIAVRQSSLNPDKEDEILFVSGLALFPEDVKSKSGKTVLVPKGEIEGVLGFQVDAGTMALSGCGRGTRIHLQVKEMIDLSGGRTRWTYDFVRSS